MIEVLSDIMKPVSSFLEASVFTLFPTRVSSWGLLVGPQGASFCSIMMSKHVLFTGS